MKTYKKTISLILALAILCLSLPLGVQAKSQEGYEGIDLYLLIDYAIYINEEPDEAYMQRILGGEIAKELNSFINRFTATNPKNRVHLLVTKTDLWNNHQVSPMSSLKNNKNIQSTKFITGPYNWEVSFLDSLKAMDKKVTPRRKPVVLSVDVTGALGYTYDFLDSAQWRAAHKESYKVADGEVGVAQFARELYQTMHELYPRKVSETRQMVDQMKESYDFYSIKLFRDTNWDPYLAKSQSYKPFNLKKEEIDRRTQDFINAAAIVDMSYMLTSYYGNMMMARLGVHGYQTAGSIQELRDQLNGLDEKLRRIYHNQPRQEPKVSPGLRIEDTWSFRNYASLGLAHGEDLPFEQIRNYKHRGLLKYFAKEGWDGNCYGMSLTVALHKIGLLNLEEFGLKDHSGRPLKNTDMLYNASKESAEPLIHVHQTYQNVLSLTSMFNKFYPYKNDNKLILDLAKEVDKVKSGGPPVFIVYEDKKTKASHAILAHNIRREPGEDGSIYIDIYDPNWPRNLNNEALEVVPALTKKGQIFYELKASLPINSDTGKITYFSTGDDLRKALNIFEDKEVGNFASLILPRNTKTFSLTENHKNRYRINPQELDGGGLTMIPLAASNQGGKDLVLIKLPKTQAVYEIESSQENLKLVYDSPHQAYTLHLHKADKIQLDSQGQVLIKNGQGPVDLQLLRDKIFGSESPIYWVTGELNGDLVAKQGSQGLDLKGEISNGNLKALENNRFESKERGKIGSSKNGKQSQAGNFKDVRKEDWFYPAVSYTYQKGTMTGVSHDLFKPQAKFTRAQMAQILYNMADRPKGQYKSQFKDVASGAWYHDSISWAYQENYVKGYGDARFGPNDPIRRQDVAMVLFNIYGQSKRVDLTVNAKFKDGKEISPYAQEAMAWAVEEGYFKGNDQGALRPQGHISRAEMAQVLYNVSK